MSPTAAEAVVGFCLRFFFMHQQVAVKATGKAGVYCNLGLPVRTAAVCSSLGFTRCWLPGVARCGSFQMPLLSKLEDLLLHLSHCHILWCPAAGVSHQCYFSVSSAVKSITCCLAGWVGKAGLGLPFLSCFLANERFYVNECFYGPFLCQKGVPHKRC